MNRLLAVLLVVAASPSQTAPAARHASAFGTRGQVTFGGEVTVSAGLVTGHFTLVDGGTTCRYAQLQHGRVHGAVAEFDALGVCSGEGGSRQVVHRFTLTDVASPGAHKDRIEVRALWGDALVAPGAIGSGELEVD